MQPIVQWLEALGLGQYGEAFVQSILESGSLRDAGDRWEYGWFTEGFGTKDLKDAKALLDELRDDLGAAVGGKLIAVAAEPPRR